MTYAADATDTHSEVTSIIRHDVKAEEHDAYEEWLREIVPLAAHFPGHRGVNVIRPAKGATEYTIVLHFDTIDNLRGWLDSKERRDLIDKAFPRLASEDRVEIKTGLEFWFTPPSKEQRAPPYKQFLVTLSAIYPLTILVPLLLVPVFDRIPLLGNLLVRQFIMDAAIVALITYAIMPRYTRLIAKWLYR
jgi:uncharacterized protein